MSSALAASLARARFTAPSPEPTDTLKEKRVELILQQLEELPTLPGVALKVLEATADDHTDAEEVVKLISTDQSLSTRILQLVHRAGSGVRGEVNSVERAVVLLGFEAVRSAVLAVTIFQTLGGDGPTTTQSSFSREEFWKHSLAVGCAVCQNCSVMRLHGVGGSRRRG